MTHDHEELEPLALARSLAGTIFGDAKNIRHFKSIGSTNTSAMQAALQGAAEGSVFIADEQLSGRGRGGHSWHSEAGSGIYLSAVLRPALDSSSALALSLIVGLCVHDAVHTVCGVIPDLRWPNDVLLNGKKMAGILTETSADTQRLHHAVVGIGINVNQSVFPPDLEPSATSLRIETGRTWPRHDLVVALLKSLDVRYSALQAQPGSATAEIIRQFELCSSFVRGAVIAVHDRDAADVQFTGRALGLDGRGFLKIETDAGVRTVLSGGIRKISAAEGI